MFGIGIWELIILIIIILPLFLILLFSKIKYNKFLKNDTKRWSRYFARLIDTIIYVFICLILIMISGANELAGYVVYLHFSIFLLLS